MYEDEHSHTTTTFGASQPRSLLPASLKLISYDYTSPIKHDPHGPRSPSRAAAIAAASALAELDRIRTPTPLERAVKAAATAAAYAELSASRLSPVRTVSPRRVSSPPPSVAISNVVEVVSPSRLYKMNIAPVQVTRVVSPTRMRASPPNLAVERYETARDERLGIVHTRNPADIIVSMAEEPVTVVRPISPRLVAALEAVPRAVSPGRYIAPLTTSVDSGALNISAVSPVAMMEAAAAAARARAQALAELQAAIPTNISPVSPYKLEALSPVEKYVLHRTIAEAAESPARLAAAEAAAAAAAAAAVAAASASSPRSPRYNPAADLESGGPGAAAGSSFTSDDGSALQPAQHPHSQLPARAAAALVPPLPMHALHPRSATASSSSVPILPSDPMKALAEKRASRRQILPLPLAPPTALEAAAAARTSNPAELRLSLTSLPSTGSVAAMPSRSASPSRASPRRASPARYAGASRSRSSSPVRQTWSGFPGHSSGSSPWPQERSSNAVAAEEIAAAEPAGQWPEVTLDQAKVLAAFLRAQMHGDAAAAALEGACSKGDAANDPPAAGYNDSASSVASTPAPKQAPAAKKPPAAKQEPASPQPAAAQPRSTQTTPQHRKSPSDLLQRLVNALTGMAGGKPSREAATSVGATPVKGAAADGAGAAAASTPEKGPVASQPAAKRALVMAHSPAEGGATEAEQQPGCSQGKGEGAPLPAGAVPVHVQQRARGPAGRPVSRGRPRAVESSGPSEVMCSVSCMVPVQQQRRSNSAARAAAAAAAALRKPASPRLLSKRLAKLQQQMQAPPDAPAQASTPRGGLACCYAAPATAEPRQPSPAEQTSVDAAAPARRRAAATVRRVKKPAAAADAAPAGPSIIQEHGVVRSDGSLRMDTGLVIVSPRKA